MLRDTLDTAGEIRVLIKFLLKNGKQYEKVEKNFEVASSEDAAEVVKFDERCLTRRTVLAKCLAKVIELYGSLFTLFDDCIQEGNLSSYQLM